MEKSEFRAVIKHLYLKGFTPKKIKADLSKKVVTSAPVFATFKHGRTSTKYEYRSKCLLEVTTLEIINKTHDMVLSDQSARYC